MDVHKQAEEYMLLLLEDGIDNNKGSYYQIMVNGKPLMHSGTRVFKSKGSARTALNKIASSAHSQKNWFDSRTDNKWSPKYLDAMQQDEPEKYAALEFFIGYFKEFKKSQYNADRVLSNKIVDRLIEAGIVEIKEL